MDNNVNFERHACRRFAAYDNYPPIVSIATRQCHKRLAPRRLLFDASSPEKCTIFEDAIFGAFGDTTAMNEPYLRNDVNNQQPSKDVSCTIDITEESNDDSNHSASTCTIDINEKGNDDSKQFSATCTITINEIRNDVSKQPTKAAPCPMHIVIIEKNIGTLPRQRDDGYPYVYYSFDVVKHGKMRMLQQIARRTLKRYPHCRILRVLEDVVGFEN